MAANDICTLCRKRGTTHNPTNKHHIKGKRYPDIMLVHSKTCHLFCQWITNMYLLMGLEAELNENIIVYFYSRIMTMRDSTIPSLFDVLRSR